MADLQQFAPEDEAAIRHAYQSPGDPTSQKVIQTYEKMTASPHYTADQVLVQPTYLPIKLEAPVKESDPSLGKVGLGIAEGTAEMLNPLAIPHGMEVLGRAAFSEDANPNQGLFGRIQERLKKAEEHSITPALGISDIAAGTRAGVRALGSDKSLKDLYKEEKGTQAEYQNQFVDPTAKGLTEAAIGITSLGGLAKDLLHVVPKLPAKLASMANQSAYSALKPLGRMVDKISGEDRVEVIGKQLLDDKIITAGATYKNILSRVQAKLKDYGEEIGYYAKTADKARSRDSAIRGIQLDELKSDIQNQIVRPLIEDPSTENIANQVSDWVSKLKPSEKSGNEISFEQAQSMKKTLDKMKAKFGTANDTISKDAFQQVYGILNNHMEKGIDTALKTAAPEMKNGFLAAKTSYRNLKDAEQAIEHTVAAENKNRFFSLSDYVIGGSSLAAGAAKGSPAMMAAGLGAAAANKLLRTQGNQAQASFFNSIAKPNAGYEKILDLAGSLNSLKEVQK